MVNKKKPSKEGFSNLLFFVTALYLRHRTSHCFCWYQTEKTVTSNLLKPPFGSFLLSGCLSRRFYRHKAMSPTIWPLLRLYLQTSFSSLQFWQRGTESNRLLRFWRPR